MRAHTNTHITCAPQPLLIEMIQFCREASKWLLKDPAHVISVHCKGGKGRTGVMIAGDVGRKKCLSVQSIHMFRLPELMASWFCIHFVIKSQRVVLTPPAFASHPFEAALLLWSGHRKCAMDAMELFTFRRTQNYDPDAGIDESVIGGLSVESFGKGRLKSLSPVFVSARARLCGCMSVRRILRQGLSTLIQKLSYTCRADIFS